MICIRMLMCRHALARGLLFGLLIAFSCKARRPAPAASESRSTQVPTRQIMQGADADELMQALDNMGGSSGPLQFNILRLAAAERSPASGPDSVQSLKRFSNKWFVVRCHRAPTMKKRVVRIVAPIFVINYKFL